MDRDLKLRHQKTGFRTSVDASTLVLTSDLYSAESAAVCVRGGVLCRLCLTPRSPTAALFTKKKRVLMEQLRFGRPRVEA